MNSDAMFKDHGIDLDEIMGEYKPHHDKGVGPGQITSFQHITSNLLNIVNGYIQVADMDGEVADQERIENVKSVLIRYIELIQEFPDFREEQLRAVPCGSPQGTGSVRAYVNSMYEQLKGKSPE